MLIHAAMHMIRAQFQNDHDYTYTVIIMAALASPLPDNTAGWQAGCLYSSGDVELELQSQLDHDVCAPLLSTVTPLLLKVYPRP